MKLFRTKESEPESEPKPLKRHDFSGPNYLAIHTLASNAGYLNSVMVHCNRCGEMVEFRYAQADPLPVEWSCKG